MPARSSSTPRSTRWRPTTRRCWSAPTRPPPPWRQCCLAACLTAGIGNIASARGIELTSVESRLEGDIDLRGLLGLSDDVRNGFERIRVTFRIAGDASDEQLRAIVEQSRSRSAVFDIVTNGVPVEIDVETA